MDKKILVTGCAGFIGYHLSNALIRENYQVIGVDSLNNAYDTKFKEKRLEGLNKSDNFVFLNKDLNNQKSIEELNEYKISTIYHMAARAGVRDSFLDPKSYITDNTNVTLNVSNYCKSNDVNELIIASTSSIYGDSGENLMIEDKDEKINPPSVYATTKLAGESLSKNILENSKTNLIIARFFTVYGPFGRPDMSILRFIHWIINEEPVQIFGDGDQERSFTYIDDVISALKKMRGLNVSNTFNVGSDTTVSLNDIIKIIEDCSGKNAKIENLEKAYKDPFVVRPNLDNTKKTIEWEPTTNVSEGIKKTVNWYKENESFLKQLTWV
tara:strand:- start:449 stop:1426 length:978 start_codon:yes stop_codon:yes gene_type:complete